MQRSFSIATTTLALAMLLANSHAQQTPAKAPPAKPKAATSSTTKKTTTGRSGTSTPLALKTEKDKFSYALGMNLGNSLHKQSVPVDPVILERGLKDALAGKTQMTEEEARGAIMAVQTEMRK